MVQLRDLDQTRVAVAIAVKGAERVLSGLAEFDANGQGGPALSVKIDDQSGSFDLIISETNWNGSIHVIDLGCEYLIRLTAGSFATK